MSSDLSIPDLPREQMFFDLPQSSLMTRRWQNFFRDLFTRVGQNNAPTNSEIEDALNILIAVKRLTATDSPYTLLSTDYNIYADTDPGAITINIPEGSNGTSYKIINTGSSNNNVIVTPNGSELLFGQNSSFTMYDGEIIDITFESTEGWW